MDNLENLCLKVVELSKEVGAFLMSEKNNITTKDIEIKGQHDYVTYVDKTAEKQIVKGLMEYLPEAGFITEEETISKQGETYNWIVDPLDGTTNFIHGMAPFATSIALKENDKIILGVIYEPNLDEVFYAWQGSKAFLNSKPIEVSKTSKLDNALLATGFPFVDYSKLEPYMQLFEWCMRNTRGVRRLGSAATDLAYVACGRMDGFYEYGLKPWDVAAGSLILERAGGIVSDFSNGDNYLFGQEILAFNKSLHSPFAEVIADYFE